MTTFNNNNNNTPFNGVERVKPIMDNQQEKTDSLQELLSRLHQFEKELMESTVKTNQIKKPKTKNRNFAYTALHEMAQMQLNLDTFIIKARNIEINNSELVEKLDIALTVEIFELLNECRSLFKYWSQKPDDRSMILEEYADGVHFILSLGNHQNITNEIIDEFVNGLYCPLPDDVTIISTIRVLVLVRSTELKAFYYGMLAQLLGLDMQMIYDAYKAKNAKNIERQNNGY